MAELPKSKAEIFQTEGSYGVDVLRPAYEQGFRFFHNRREDCYWTITPYGEYGARHGRFEGYNDLPDTLPERGMEGNFVWPPVYKEDVIILDHWPSGDDYDAGYRVVTWGSMSTAHQVTPTGWDPYAKVVYDDLPDKPKDDEVKKTLEEAVLEYLRAGRSINVNPIISYLAQNQFFGADVESQQNEIEKFLTQQAGNYGVCNDGVRRFRSWIGDLLPKPKVWVKRTTTAAAIYNDLALGTVKEVRLLQDGAPVGKGDNYHISIGRLPHDFEVIAYYQE